MKRITIKDVAKDANVSIATVSKVINNKGYVSEATFDKVTQSIEKLGYRVNANARNLKSATSNKVAVLISDISNIYLMSIAKEVEKTISSLGYHMILMSHNDDEEIEYASLKILLEQRVAALVIIPTGRNAETIQSFIKSHIPVIALDREVEGLETDLIVDNNYYGSFRSVEYLYELGHKRIGIIYGHTNNSIGRERYEGAVEAIHHFGLVEEDLYIKKTNFDEQLSYRATMELLSLPNAPSAIYSCNNTITKGVLKAIWDLGLSIPEDISLIAFGDSKQWELVTPKLTLMTQTYNRIGIETSILLKNRLTLKEDFPLKKTYLKPMLQLGNSCEKFNDEKEKRV